MYVRLFSNMLNRLDQCAVITSFPVITKIPNWTGSSAARTARGVVAIWSRLPSVRTVRIDIPPHRRAYHVCARMCSMSTHAYTRAQTRSQGGSAHMLTCTSTHASTHTCTRMSIRMVRTDRRRVDILYRRG